MNNRRLEKYYLISWVLISVKLTPMLMFSYPPYPHNLHLLSPPLTFISYISFSNLLPFSYWLLYWGIFSKNKKKNLNFWVHISVDLKICHNFTSKLFGMVWFQISLRTNEFRFCLCYFVIDFNKLVNFCMNLCWCTWLNSLLENSYFWDLPFYCCFFYPPQSLVPSMKPKLLLCAKRHYVV